MIVNIKNQFILNVWTVIISFLFCLVFLFLPLTGKTEEKLDFTKKPDIEYTAGNFRDPFQCPILPYKEEEKEVSKVKGEIKLGKPRASEIFSFSIQGIIWNSDIPVVIINNQVLRKGDVFLMPVGRDITEEVTITDIDKDGVTISYSGQTERLPSPANLELQKIKGGKNE